MTTSDEARFERGMVRIIVVLCIAIFAVIVWLFLH
jgi:hypothetical protein